MDNYYWLIILGVFVLFYIFLMVRQKRQEKRSLEVMESFKVGDRVVTHIGIYGKIKRIYNTSFGKTCLLEIGATNKIDIELDMRFIASKDEKVMVEDQSTTTVEKSESVNQTLADSKQEAPAQELQETQENKKEKQTKKKKTSTSKGKKSTKK